MLFIGIDLGTSACKLLLVGEDGTIQNEVTKEYPLSFPHPGWAEQRPEDWWDAVLTGVPELLRGFDANDVASIGSGGQMHGLVALDEHDHVIRPAILWNDGRTFKEVDYLNNVVGKDRLSELTANIAFAGFTAPKLLWMRENEPENFRKIAKIMLPKDYLTYKLTGVHACDYSDASGMLLLDVQHVTMRFGGITAVNDLSMRIPTGSITGLIGPNGAGKTTAFNVISGFYNPQEGDILFKGHSVKGFPPHRICRAGMARTFQNIRLFGSETALENVMVGCQVRRKSQWWMPVFSLPSARREEEEIREKAKGLIHRLALDSYMDEKASSLPYGAQRRLEIARALATSPDFLLLDEPAAGMNPQESTELMRFIRHIRDEFDLTILLIEHDMKVVMGVCQYIWVLEYGQLIAEGDPDAIRNNPRVIEAYLGEDVSNHA